MYKQLTKCHLTNNLRISKQFEQSTRRVTNVIPVTAFYHYVYNTNTIIQKNTSLFGLNRQESDKIR